MIKTKTCIYCLQNKPEVEFNREHVISRMFGTYDNAPVLNHCEVCSECNSYFGDNLENVLSMDSYEGFLRTRSSQRERKSVGRPIGKTRISFTGQNGIFKGLKLYVSTNPNNNEKIQVEAAPSVGIVRDVALNEYDYYQLDEIPECSDHLRDNMKRSLNPIVFFGYAEEEVFSQLLQKGYDLSKAKYQGNFSISDLTTETNILIEMNSKVDTLLARLAAKNILNYLCFTYGRAYVLNKQFDAIRNYARFGSVTSPIKMCINNGGIIGLPEKIEDNHVIGTAWAAVDSLFLCGFVSWFGAITYSFLLEDYSNKTILPPKKFTICNNQTRKLQEWADPLFIDWPNSKYVVKILNDGKVQLVPRKESD